MSFYHEAASILTGPDSAGSLKSRVFNNKTLKSPPAQLYALACETSKWSDVLREVVERSQLLTLEKKLTPVLAVLLVHDLLLSKRGVALPASHPLKAAVTKHKARLNAEFVKARLRRGFATTEALKNNIGTQIGSTPTDANVLETADARKALSRDGKRKHYPHPRWVRVNTLRTSLKDQLATTFKEYTPLDTVHAILEPPYTRKVLHIDCHIPDLLALPPGVDLTTTSAYLHGVIIFQDKASCFPAYLLDPHPEDGEIIDACAAPGNKTTHLAALLSSHRKGSGLPHSLPKIFAFERDKDRAETLKKMTKTAGTEQLVTIKAGQDFLRASPHDEAWKNVGALLLDPSCSGSGIVGRDDIPRLVLPSREAAPDSSRKKRKRKRGSPSKTVVENTAVEALPLEEEEGVSGGSLAERLTCLSAFQLKLLLHAFAFPSAKKITYSTCSIYAEENEHVVIKALNSDIAKQEGWRVLRREEQGSGLKGWKVRGSLAACEGLVESNGGIKEVVVDACLRCSKGDEEGTMGFFVAGFVRDRPSGEQAHTRNPETIESGVGEDAEEWKGFSEDETQLASGEVPLAQAKDQSRSSGHKTLTDKKQQRKKKTWDHSVE